MRRACHLDVADADLRVEDDRRLRGADNVGHVVTAFFWWRSRRVAPDDAGTSTDRVVGDGHFDVADAHAHVDRGGGALAGIEP